MKFKTASIIYFSPTGTTKKYVREIVKQFDVKRLEEINLTYIQNRKQKKTKIETDLVVIGFPVYEEYAPQLFTNCLEYFSFNNQPGICISVYGKIGFGMSLKQIYNSLSEKKLKIITMGAFIAEHSFSTEKIPLGIHRPTGEDLNDIKKLTNSFKNRIENNSFSLNEKLIPGHLPMMARILPKNSANLFTESPRINNNCTKCLVCIKNCPVEAIDKNLEVDNNKCIRCFACVKKCHKKGRDIKFKKEFLIRKVFKIHESKNEDNLVI